MKRTQGERIFRSRTVTEDVPRWSRALLLLALSLLGCESVKSDVDPVQAMDASPLGDGEPADALEGPRGADSGTSLSAAEAGARPGDAAARTRVDGSATLLDAGTIVGDGGVSARDSYAPASDAAPRDAQADARAGYADASSSDQDHPRDDAGLMDATPWERPQPLADQTQPTMTNGISIDERGYLWVAAGAESQLLRLEPPGETIVERHATQSVLDGPDDLVATPDAIYYTAMLAGNVNKFDRRTGRNTVVGRVGIGANPIVLTSAGVLLAGIAPGPVPALAPLFTGLFEVDPTGVTRPRQLLRDSRAINAFCVPPDGHVYGPTQTTVVRIDLTKGIFTTIREGFGYAGSVRYNPRDQQLYVLDVDPKESPNGAMLYRMRLDGSAFAPFARLSDVKEDFAADNFAIAADGTFYVTRLYEPKITRVSADGSRAEDFVIGKPK